ncbi:hypothetical protein HRD49_14760 [Corallococcus exiguus]|uniref:hypothetical protein n=1 Tax=Corallococcus exiguus TaxID=83462 RepID=UPI00155FFF5F|nr:hypothetical protein [Corallococcus exiguus]NRD63008.1 hypothetical protein [Corallococcus exiguus]
MASEQWIMKAVRNGITPINEANTSRYVHVALTDCLNWPFEAIIPQASKRGYIDYKLKHPNSSIPIHVEVKPLHKKLNNSMIRGYLVQKGTTRDAFRVGILTNLARWQIFLAGPRITKATGQEITQILDADFSFLAGIKAVEHLVGFKQAEKLHEVRAALGRKPDIASHMLCNNPTAIMAVRAQLKLIRDSDGIAFRIPNYKSTVNSLRMLTKNKPPRSLTFDVNTFQRAACAPAVAKAIGNSLAADFGSQVPINTIRSNLKGLF